MSSMKWLYTQPPDDTHTSSTSFSSQEGSSSSEISRGLCLRLGSSASRLARSMSIRCKKNQISSLHIIVIPAMSPFHYITMTSHTIMSPTPFSSVSALSKPLPLHHHDIMHYMSLQQISPVHPHFLQSCH